MADVSHTELTLNIPDNSPQAISEIVNLILNAIQENENEERWYVDVHLKSDMKPSKLMRFDRQEFLLTIMLMISTAFSFAKKPHPETLVLMRHSSKEIRLGFSNDASLIKEVQKIVKPVKTNPCPK
jgi:hypothetical protein